MPNVAKFAKALYALHVAGCLADEACKPAVGTFIRQATETPLFHLTTHFRSRAAESVLSQQIFRSPAEYHRWCRRHLRHEHMVPTSVILQLLITTPNISEEYIATVLRRYGYRATITLGEDAYLREQGFGQTMPDAFWTPGSEMFENPCARYIAAELSDKLVRRTAGTWFE